MSIDGVFIHYLVKELETLKHKRINKIYDLGDKEFVFNLSNKERLFISLNLNHSHLRITKKEQNTFDEPTNLCMVLRKHLERGIITDIYQKDNDRIVILEVKSRDELGYEENKYLILELMGRHANLILTDQDFTIIDCLRKTPFDSVRLLIPRVKYEMPESGKANPFKLNDSNYNLSDLEGVSNILKEEIRRNNSLTLTIKQDIKPTIITDKNKIYFYCFDLLSIAGDRKNFSTISELLDYYFTVILNINHEDQKNKSIINFLKREVNKNIKKLAKQETELTDARENLTFEKLGNLLSSNLYKIQRNMKTVLLEDFYNNNELIELTLDPLLSPTQNLESYFNKYKKAKRTLDFLSVEINKTKEHLDYLETIISQIKISDDLDIREIALELGLEKAKKTVKKKNTKPNFLTFTYQDDSMIFVGKNNMQNNYLTHTLANRNDYFFHVKNFPGSHTILRTNNLSDELINLAASFAAYYSSRGMAKIEVDYTLIKNVKKVRGRDGSFVIYDNFKTVTVQPDLEYIKSKTKQINYGK